MIRKISNKQNINPEILNRIVSIHKECIATVNSKHYDQKQIEEWLSVISIKNIQDQLFNTIWIVMEKDNQIVGFAQYSLEDKELYQIQVLPSEQAKGYGKKLYKYIEKDFRKNNLKGIALYATLNAISFYKSLGFESVGKKDLLLITASIQMEIMKKDLL